MPRRRRESYAEIALSMLGNRKIKNAAKQNPAAPWLYIASILHANRKLSDGFLYRDELDEVAIQAGIASRQALKCAEILVELGAFEPDPDGWVIHDFLEWNDDRATVERRRAIAADRQKRFRERKEAEGLAPVTHLDDHRGGA